MKSKKKKYWVHYVENSTPSIKGFASKESLDRFVKKFTTDEMNGYWIDFTFKGQFIHTDDYYQGSIK